MGPFYCPRDQRIYLDTAFFDDLQNKFGGCSDSNACKFSEAYVIAHEVGHHVQDELGILPRVMQAQQASNSKVESKLSRCASNCKPIASPVFGRTIHSKRTSFSILATSTKLCKPRPPSETTACRGKLRGTSYQTRSPTELPRSESDGS
jgi:Putative neutral zinc metallopeptidase